MLMALFLAGIFILDVWFIHDSNISFTYLLVIILGLFLSERNDVLLLGIVATALTVLAVIFQYQAGMPAPLDQMLFARIISVAGIWTGVYLVITIISMRRIEAVQEEQFQALFQYATNGMILVDQQGKIVRSNPASEELFGYNSTELIGRPIEMLIPARLSRRHQEHRSRYRENPHPRSMGTGLDLYAARKNGTEFPVEVSLSPIRTAEGDFVMAFIVDNTLRKENEQRIIRQNQQLEQLAAALQNLNEGLEEKVRERTQALEKAKNDLAAALETERELGELKSRFVSMASHEFRTPLSTVLSSAALIQSYAERQDMDNIFKHTLRIKTAVNNLNTILTEFLSLGKLEEGKTETNLQATNLSALIQEAHLEMKGLFRSGQTFEHLHDGETTAWIDPGLFKHILLNLISNAIKYSPENSLIQVVSKVGRESIQLSVADQGMGIPAADQKHLFSRFFRATNSTNIQGTGLGLYIVKRYVELMDGTIGFTSEEGKGSTFQITLPQRPESGKNSEKI